MWKLKIHSRLVTQNATVLSGSCFTLDFLVNREPGFNHASAWERLINSASAFDKIIHILAESLSRHFSKKEKSEQLCVKWEIEGLLQNASTCLLPSPENDFVKAT
ncbi:hypothetical protein CEXT_656231 [Caerostris extrusa]|uniref:Uncharacterized protein n=1 Tax=Caerostris extrusa TaxID=172846 RepID=A0AAV4U126_CAEEX|nr:hypothetical protein CEXT_656231 [Caerostris extrusa]